MWGEKKQPKKEKWNCSTGEIRLTGCKSKKEDLYNVVSNQYVISVIMLGELYVVLKQVSIYVSCVGEWRHTVLLWS